MYPVGGFVYVREVQIEPEHGPYKIIKYFQLDKDHPDMYYDLDKIDNYHFLEDELRPASNTEELHHRITQ